MNDAEYLFHADAREKKITGRSSRAKATPGKRVRMPHDGLTEKEIRKMSGEVKSYNLKKPMKWAEYCEMPDDLRKQYLTRLRNTYNATNTGIGSMFGVTDVTVGKECRRLGVRSLTRADRATPEFANFVKYGSPERQIPEQTIELKEDTPAPKFELDTEAVAKAVANVFAPLPEEMRKREVKAVDMINHPPHYTAGDIECIDAIAAATAKLTGMEAVCTAQIIKYVWRWKYKNGAEDLAKARYYLDKLMEVIGQ